MASHLAFNDISLMATGPGRAPSPSTGLDEDDLGDLHEILYPVRMKYQPFGLQIGVRMREIESIESQYADPGERLLRVLRVRLNKTKPITWRDIDAALRSYSVDEGKVADGIYGHLFSTGRSLEGVEQEHVETQDAQRRKKREKKGKGAQMYYKKPVSDKESPQNSKKDVRDIRQAYGKGESKKQKSIKTPKMPVRSMVSKMASDDQEDHQIDEKSKRSKKQKAVKAEFDNESSAAGSEEDESQSDNEVIRKSKLRKQQPPEYTPMKLQKGKERHQKKEKNIKYQSSQIPRAAEVNEEEEQHSDEEVSEKPAPSKSKRWEEEVSESESENESSPSASSEEEISKMRSCYSKKATKKPAKSITKHHKKHTDKTATTEKVSEKEKRSGRRIDKSPTGPKEKQSRTAPVIHKTKAPAPSATFGKGADLKSRSLQTQTGEHVEKRRGPSGNKAKKRDTSPSDSSQNDFEEEKSDPDVSSENEEDDDTEQKSSNEEEETEPDDEPSPASSEEEEVKKRPRKSESHLEERKVRDTRIQARRRGKKKTAAVNDPDSPGDDEQLGPDDRGRHQDENEHRPMKQSKRRHMEISVSSTVKEKKGKRDGKKKKEETLSTSSETDDSSPECDMSKKLSEAEIKQLRKIFKCFFGKLCCAMKDPVETAAQLQAKRLLSLSTMEDILISPESRPVKAITLVRALYKRIKPRPDRIFTITKVFLQIECLKDIGREMWTETGKESVWLH